MARRQKESEQTTTASAPKVDTTLDELTAKADDSSVVIVSKRRAGKAIVGIEGKKVSFDTDGKAAVSVKEARYFLTIPDFALEKDNKDAQISVE